MIKKLMVISASALILASCGQSGALMLPSDPNMDRRSQYMLYKVPEQADAKQTQAADPTIPVADIEDQ